MSNIHAVEPLVPSTPASTSTTAAVTVDNVLENQISECLDYINQVRDPSIISEFDETVANLTQLLELVTLNDELPSWQLFAKHSTSELFRHILDYLHGKLSEMDYYYQSISQEQPTPRSRSGRSVNQLRLLTFENVLGILDNVLHKSFESRRYFTSTTLLYTFGSFISNESFLAFDKKAQRKYLSLFLSIVNCLSTVASENKQLWTELKFFDLLYARLLPKHQHELSLFHRHLIYAIIGNIAIDKQLESIEKLDAIIDEFKEVFKSCRIIEKLNSGEHLRRNKVDFVDMNQRIVHYEVAVIEYSSGEQTRELTGLLKTLYNFSINETTKKVIGEKLLVPEIRTFILKGNEIEKKFAIDLLAQLCFNDDVSRQVSASQSDLIAFVKELSLDDKLTFKSLRRQCNELLFQLQMLSSASKPGDDTTTHLPVISSPSSSVSVNVLPPPLASPSSTTHIDGSGRTARPTSATHDQNKHIMISYNAKNRPLCLEIKHELEKIGYKVWIDVEDIHGSSLDAMAHAVENCFCMLMCVTEHYRQSTNCQAEAQYAFKLKKAIVPLIMQQGYSQVQGWLGFIIGDRIFIDFTKHEFDACMKRLLNEIKKYQSKSTIVKATSPQPLSTSQQSAAAGTMSANDLKVLTVAQTFIHRTESQIRQKAQQQQRRDSTGEEPVTTKNTVLPVESWSQDDVEKWFRAKGLELRLFQALKPVCNGRVLLQLHKMRKDAPEFYFQSIKDKLGGHAAELTSLLLFTDQLETLFNNY